eukprot:245671-Prymnesium_polylepis.1
MRIRPLAIVEETVHAARTQRRRHPFPPRAYTAQTASLALARTQRGRHLLLSHASRAARHIDKKK